MTEVAGEKTIVSVDSLNPWEQAFLEKVDHQSTQWRFPVGDGQGNPPRGYYNAQGFQENAHLGDDWNGRGGGNSDLGDPVFTISTGWVRRAENAGPGWGNVVRVVHQIKKGDEVKYIESIYAHLDSMYVKAGAFVADSQQIGTIGNANGAYYAHLHLEVRKYAGLPLGVGYSTEHEFHYDPTEFILKSRK
ncbi:MAG: M23 family metallopeptidase [Flavobacteriales bacterium]|nr:M23 family metallopeptidase [Flavobacteriales bacterium]